MTERQIDEILAASFPASDPPSWTLGREVDPEPDTTTGTVAKRKAPGENRKKGSHDARH